MGRVGSGGQGSEEALACQQGGQGPAPGPEQDPEAAGLSSLRLTLLPSLCSPRGSLGHLGLERVWAARKRFSLQLFTELLHINGYREHGLFFGKGLLGLKYRKDCGLRDGDRLTDD